jgi:hypothetical protein
MMKNRNPPRVLIIPVNKGSVNIAAKTNKRWYLLILDSASM